MTHMILKDPLFELTSLQDRVNQLFGRAFGGVEGVGSGQAFTPLGFLPPVDISEDDHNIKVKAEIPGVKPEDLTLTLENNVLTITGERKFKDEDEKDNFHRMERRFGKFTRSFTLPPGLDAANINATFEDGVLTITLPKKEEFKPKQIAISVTKTPPAQVKTGTGRDKAA